MKIKTSWFDFIDAVQLFLKLESLGVYATLFGFTSANKVATWK